MLYRVSSFSYWPAAMSSPPPTSTPLPPTHPSHNHPTSWRQHQPTIGEKTALQNFCKRTSRSWNTPQEWSIKYFSGVPTWEEFPYLPVFCQCVVCFFSSVWFQMSPQITCLDKCKITLVAFVWLFSAMYFQMCLQIACIRGCIITLVAFVWLLSLSTSGLIFGLFVSTDCAAAQMFGLFVSMALYLF